MLETRAIVVHVDGTEATVEALEGGGCGSCGSGACGSSQLSKLFCVRPRQFRARNDAHATVGEEVRIAVRDGMVLRSALILYGLPLLLMFAGAPLGMHTLGGDGGAAIGAAAGLAAGFLLARVAVGRSRLAEPVIIRGRE